MKYDALSRTTVKIILSEEDMREYSLCAENISLRTPDSKQKLTKIIQEIKLFPEHETERLFLEVFPRSTGGCVLYVSALDNIIPDIPLWNRESGALICTVSSFDHLIKLSRRLKELNCEIKAEVCKLREDYLIKINSDDTLGRVSHALSEYGEISFDLNYYYKALEQGEIIGSDNIIPLLSELY